MNGQSPQTEEAPAAGEAAQDSLAGAAKSLAQAVAELIGGTLQLATLEARLAALSLATMLMLAVGAALLLATAWLLLAAALAVWLVRLGLGWELALVGVAGLNLALSVPAWYLIRHLSRNLLFSATRRHLGTGDRLAGESRRAAGTDPSADRDS